MEHEFSDFDEAKGVAQALAARDISATVKRRGSGWVVVIAAAQTPAVPAPHPPSGSIADFPWEALGSKHRPWFTMPEILKALRSGVAWLESSECELLEHTERAISEGKQLDEYTERELIAIFFRIDRRLRPQVVGGGGPGTGRRA